MVLRNSWGLFVIGNVNLDNMLSLPWQQCTPSSISWGLLGLINREGTAFLMMTSSNGNIFRVTGLLCGKFTGTGEFHAERPVIRSFISLICAWINSWVNTSAAGDLRRNRAHYDVTQSRPLWRHCNMMYYLVHVSHPIQTGCLDILASDNAIIIIS